MDARTGRRGPALGRRTFLALLGASALSACGDDSAEAERTPLAGATVLRENLPKDVDGVRLIAFNIDPDRAGLHLGSDRRTIRLDETLSVGGTRYTVAELVPTHPARGEHANGWVSLTRE